MQAPANSTALRAAEGLAGLVLPGGWRLVSEVAKFKGGTGSNFCVGYGAKGPDDGDVFVKVIDLLGHLRKAPDIMQALTRVTAEVGAERSVLESCKTLSRIIRLIDHGQFAVPRFSGALEGIVFYLVFESAEADVRRHLSLEDSAQTSWKLAVLKDIAQAIHQLDGAGIAHQDIKPSNVLVMPGNGVRKLADMGRAVRKGAAGPHDGWIFPGDRRYQPLSASYGVRDPDWVDGRTASDLYMLGLLVVFLFTGLNLTAVQIRRIPPQFHFANWKGSFEDVLPILVDVHSKALEDVEDGFPSAYRGELVELVRRLTHPNPRERGDPRARQRVGHPAGTEVFVSRFAALAKRAKLGLAE